jgi:hypothetical protein
VNSTAGAGTITFTSDIGDTSGAGVTGTTAIGNATTAALNFNSTVYNFDGATTIKAATGDTIDVTGGATSFTTAADDISFTIGNIALKHKVTLCLIVGKKS